jgi:O-antigen/teichoic acid export membrane protein
VLCASGWLFNVALGGKYALGLSVLPWTLTYCTWFALSTLLQNYLWCAEKTALVSLAMLVGLLANVGLNLLLLPRLGLPGAVMATTTGSLVMLSLVCGFCLRLGLRIDRGAWLTLALPAAFCLGPRAALIAAALMGIAVLRTNLVFRRREKAEFLLGCRRYLRRFQDYRSRRSGRFGPTLDAEIS